MEKKPKKTTIITIITFVLCLFCICLTLFTGCSDNNDTQDRFKRVKYENSVYIYIDKETRVMYLWVSPNLKKGGLTLMVDENGKPLLWEGEL